MDVLGADYTHSALVGSASLNAPVVDGTIGNSEYTYSRVIKPYDHLLLEVEGPDVYGETYDNYITEYFAYDADYIYYAYSMLRDDTAGGAVIFIPLEANYTLSSIGTPDNKRLIASKALTITGNVGTLITVVADGAAAPEVGTDVAYHKVIGTGNVSYVEFKISKQYLADARGVDKSEITSFEYSVYEDWNYYAVPTGSSWGYITIDHHVTDAEAALLTAAGAEAAPARIYNTVKLAAIATRETASIRLSPSNSGIRFKTDVSKSELDKLIATYGEGNVKVGTLITLEEILGENELTADAAFQTVDVEATVASPFASADGVNTYAGSLTNLNPNNFAKNFAARGYIAYRADAESEWTYIYSDVTALRSAAYVANQALESGKYAEDATALAILNAYAAAQAN